MKEAAMAGLSFVTPLAYDWKYAFDAVRSYYAIADEIILGLDVDRISFSKQPFPFDDAAVADLIAQIDTDKKIRIVEANFHSHDTPLESDTAERRLLGAICRMDNWVVQIDADEILLNPFDFKRFMQNASPDVCVWAVWLPVYKIIGDKALVIGGHLETHPVATCSPHLYTFGRVTNQPTEQSMLYLLHLSFCRDEEELVRKLTNWGHSNQIDLEKTVALWRATTLENYYQLRDFHHIHGPLWKFLKVIDWPPKALFDARDLQQLVSDFASPNTPDGHVVVQGKTAGGGRLISFGKS
jgi:hypothetical protein